jgi:hypothetical protein
MDLLYGYKKYLRIDHFSEPDSDTRIKISHTIKPLFAANCARLAGCASYGRTAQRVYGMSSTVAESHVNVSGDPIDSRFVNCVWRWKWEEVGIIHPSSVERKRVSLKIAPSGKFRLRMLWHGNDGLGICDNSMWYFSGKIVIDEDILCCCAAKLVSYCHSNDEREDAVKSKLGGNNVLSMR